MPPFNIEKVARSAANYLKRLPRKEQQLIAQALNHLCNTPFDHPNPTVIKPLKGQYKGLWRYRLGNIRIIYEVDKEQHTIRIVSIDNRGNVY